MMRTIQIILFLLLSLSFNTFSSGSFNVLDFGAKADGKTICTKAFNTAIERCTLEGGGVVTVPKGTFKCGTIQMKNNVELHFEIGATLLASTEPSDFPQQPTPQYRSQKDAGGWFSLIYAERQTNIAITGFGTIDGNGSQHKGNPKASVPDQDGRPRNILFISCSKVRIEGIRMVNSGIWNQHYLNCEDVVIDRIEVYNHSNRNNDAIDIDGCRQLVLSNSILDSDDDGITLKSTGEAPCEDILINNCIVSSFCNAIKAGTESTGGFKNIVISNCTVKPSRHSESPVFMTARHGITGISLEIVDGGTLEGVTISNITIEGTECPLYIRLGNRARKYIPGATEPPVGIIRNIAISNIVAYNTGNFSNSITAIPGHFVENVSITNFQCYNSGNLKTGRNPENHFEVTEDEKGYPQPTVWKDLPSSVFFIRHAKNVTIDNLMFGNKGTELRPPIIAVDVENLRIGKSIFTSTSNARYFTVIKQVTNYDIEMPLGWTGEKLLK